MNAILTMPAKSLAVFSNRLHDKLPDLLVLRVAPPRHLDIDLFEVVGVVEKPDHGVAV